MEKQKSSAQKIWTPLLATLIMVGGMWIGYNLRDSLRNKRDIQAIIQRNDRLEEIIDLVNEKYVDTVNMNLLYRDAVNGILTHLDPHTVYISADELQGVNEDLEGSFSGIGVEFNIFRDTVMVTSVIENGPAAQAGLEVGDKFIKVNNSVVAGKKITSEDIIKLLRGKEGTVVNVIMKDAITGKNKNLSVSRGAIPLYSVDASVMLDDVTGFIKIDRFSATTFDEFMRALQNLKAAGMKQLILDLRQNPGGYLDAATKIADQFLNYNKLIVYTQGRKNAKEEYKAKEDGLFENGPLIILIDENAASASEILSGAIQDWDRGIIIGRRSFGKGLVQEQYNLGDGSALRLTVAKYYTPSGRSIQRSFAKGKEAYLIDWEKRFENGELTRQDTAVYQDTVKYYTANHRTVYGGGGIKPDVYVPYDTTKIATEVLKIVFSDALRIVLWDYFTANKTMLKQYATVQQFEKNFSSTGVIIKNYTSDLPDSNKKIVTKLLVNPTNNSYIQTAVKAQLARILFKSNGYYYVYSHEDDVVNKALEVLHSNNYSKLISR